MFIGEIRKMHVDDNLVNILSIWEGWFGLARVPKTPTLARPSNSPKKRTAATGQGRKQRCQQGDLRAVFSPGPARRKTFPSPTFGAPVYRWQQYPVELFSRPVKKTLSQPRISDNF